MIPILPYFLLILERLLNEVVALTLVVIGRGRHELDLLLLPNLIILEPIALLRVIRQVLGEVHLMALQLEGIYAIFALSLL